jgi:hypothetical protein
LAARGVVQHPLKTKVLAANVSAISFFMVLLFDVRFPA